MRSALGCFALTLLAVSASRAFAEDADPFNDTPDRMESLLPLRSGCVEATYWQRQVPDLASSNVARCHAPPREAWQAIQDAAVALETAVGRLAAYTEVPAACAVAKAAVAPTVAGADAESSQAAAVLALAQQKAAAATRTRDHATIEVQAIETAGVGPDKAKRLAAAKKELDDAERALAAAQEDVRRAQSALEAAAQTVKTERSRHGEAARVAADVALARLRTAAQLTVLRARSPEKFEALLADPERRAACLAYRAEWLELYQPAKRDQLEAAADVQAAAAAAADHAEDVLRKASTLVSGAFGANGFAEKPGSPDRAVFSLMSALGADSKAAGNQVVMTLNLASLLIATEAERVKTTPLARNLFLRATLPLEATDPVPVTGTATAADGPGVTRFSLTIGTSLFDETDTRLPENAACYQLALAYLPLAATDEATIERDRRERAAYFDVCARLAANRQRLALRAGIGFASRGALLEETTTEVVALAAVWAPSSVLYFNAIIQRLLEPARYWTYGGGVSLAFNAGGRASGVDSWARLGVDFLVLRTEADDSGASTFEVRITPNARIKVLENAFLTIGAGPRIADQSGAKTGLLATVALTYDSDELFDRLLSARPETPAPPGAGL